MRILNLMKTSELIKFKSKWNKLFLNSHTINEHSQLFLLFDYYLVI